ncbi:MAG: hypothetical protein K8J08_14685 [Thermoanaerobaculia bacterium]|nr:hypothetical protein [Thermoanaerobaculia bacterium]
MTPGSFVVFHLDQPSEKLWGILDRLGPEGVTLRGISLNSFDDWVRGIVRQEETLGLSTQFVPLTRVRTLYLDEQVGTVESYCARFQRAVGYSVEQHLGIAAVDPALEDTAPS